MRIKRHTGLTVDATTFRQIVGVYIPSYTSDGRGGETVSYSLLTQLYADVQSETDTRTLQELGFTVNDIYKVRTRFVNITNAAKILWNGNYYTIHKTSDLGLRQRYLEIICYTKQGASQTIQINPAVNNLEYITVGGETSLTYNGIPSLIGKTVLLVSIGGVETGAIITTGTPTGSQILFNSTTGTLTFSNDTLPLPANVLIRILYQ